MSNKTNFWKMNIALIIAGGSGNRMGQDIPKQFMKFNTTRSKYKGTGVGNAELNRL